MRIGMTRYTQVLQSASTTPPAGNHVFHTCYDCFLGNRWRCNDINQIPVFDFYITVTTGGHLAQTVNRPHPSGLLKIINSRSSNDISLGWSKGVHPPRILEADSRTDDIFNIKPVKTTRRFAAAASKTCWIRDTGCGNRRRWHGGHPNQESCL